MDEKLAGALSSGAVCVAATERLAQAVRRDYDGLMCSRDAKCWPAPTVLTWEAWVRGLWEEGWQPRTVAPPLAARVLWEEIIAADAALAGFPLLDVTATATVAMEAEQLLALYAIELDGQEQDDEECAAFRRWRSRYAEELDGLAWVAGERLDLEVAALLFARVVSPPGSLVLYGFDEPPPPARAALLRALESRGTRIEELSPPTVEGRVGRFRALDREDEVRCAALWAGAALMENPQASVGVVAVVLDDARALVERLFPALLTPTATICGEGLDRPPWDISLGGPLADEPVAAGALGLLSLLDGKPELGEWRKVLGNPFWDAGSDGLTRALLARLLTGLDRKRLSLETLIGELLGGVLSKAPGAPALAARLRLLEAAADAKGEKPPSAWALSMAASLASVGWAGTASLTSREYQAAEKTRELFAALNVLDAVKPLCSYGWALERLVGCAAAPFRPKVGDAPIRVLGMLEASGVSFDRLWVLGADDRALPPESRANPFIPFHAQVRAGIRQVTPAEALARARRIVARLAASAGEVVFSSPGMLDGAPSGPSPLIASLPEVMPRLMEDLSLTAQVARCKAASLRREEDCSTPLLAAEEVRGGSRLFAWQAQCPFRAFVELRLGVEAERGVEEGLGRGLQGTMLHLALKELHTRFPDHDSIAGASGNEKAEALRSAVAIGAAEARKRGVSEALLKVEAERMVETLSGWLDVEAERPDFRVLEREAVKRLVIGSIPVKLQIDRLDRVTGGALVIDYKTTARAPSLADMTGQRLTEPQLPLYALACEDSVGVAYALMERGGCKLSGLAETEAGPQIKPRSDWPELKEHWRRKLKELAGEFEEGRADADPGGERKFCVYCGLDPVCRVTAATDRSEGEE